MRRQKRYISLITGVFFLIVAFKGQNRLTPYPFPYLKLFPVMPVDTANPVTVEGAELGRHLFYDTRLSNNGILSCGSCHKQEAAFADAPHAFSKGRDGILMSRNTPPIFNLVWHSSFFWDGKAKTIEAQVLHPVRIHNEMDLPWAQAAARIKKDKFYVAKFKEVYGEALIDSGLIAKAIGQFERTLISYRSKYDRVTQGKGAFTDDEYEGFNLVNDMTRGDCLHCHTTDSDPLGSTFLFSNNGLDSIVDASNYKDLGRGGITGSVYDRGRFKIPSLRNVMLTAPYMHDGRFKTIDEVIEFYSNGVHPCANIDPKMEFASHHGAHFTPQEKKQIIAFLRTLTDSAFISDPSFSDPFKK